MTSFIISTNMLVSCNRTCTDKRSAHFTMKIPEQALIRAEINLQISPIVLAYFSALCFVYISISQAYLRAIKSSNVQSDRHNNDQPSVG